MDNKEYLSWTFALIPTVLLGIIDIGLMVAVFSILVILLIFRLMWILR